MRMPFLLKAALRLWDTFPRSGYVAVRLWLASHAFQAHWHVSADRLLVASALEEALADARDRMQRTPPTA